MNNVIFLQHLHDSRKPSAEESTDSAIFYHFPQSTPEEISGVENEAVENPDEYDRRHQLADDIKSMSRTQLRLNYPGTYSSWKNIKQRCKRGKGELHPEFEQFPDFLLAVGPRPADGYTVDRIDFDNPEYGPSNCRWAPKSVQTANRRNTRILTDSQGTRHTVAEWSRKWGVPGKLILQRVDRDRWSVDDAVRPERKAAPSTAKTNTPTKSLFPDAAPAHLQAMLDRFTQGLSEHHDCPIFLLEWKHLKQLEYIHEGLLRCGVSPTEVIEMVVRRWHKFAPHKSAPKSPCLMYLKQNVMPAAHFYLMNGGTRLQVDCPDQYFEPTTPLDTERDL